MDIVKSFILRLLLCIPFVLALSWVLPTVDHRPAADPKLQTAVALPLPPDTDPWAGMPDEERVLGDAEVAR